MIRRYSKNKTNEDETAAVEEAIRITRAMKNGDIRMKIVEMVLMNETHSIAGAALKVNYSESAVKSFQGDFVRTVGSCFKCNGLH